MRTMRMPKREDKRIVMLPNHPTPVASAVSFLLHLGALVAVGGALMAVAMPAAASLLPDATSSVLCQQSPQPDSSGATSCAQASARGHNSGLITLSPFVDVSVEVTSLPFTGAGSVYAELNYSFEVVGGTPGDRVPLLIATALSASSPTPHGSAFAAIAITTSLGSVGETVCMYGTCGEPAEFSGELSIAAFSGAVNTVALRADVGGDATPTGSFTNAEVDPWIFVDPAFNGASNYSILLSAGVGNGVVQQVPEPSTLWLLSTGCPILGLMRRRVKDAKAEQKAG
jgi:hypothetical protein